MFDLIFAGAQAYEQVGWFIGALMCLGIGGLILGNSLYRRLHAFHVQGTIVGVIAKDRVYFPVYRYTSQDGQTRVAKSDTGSSLVRGKETGRVVSLIIAPHDPTRARDATGHLFDIIGMVLFALGVWLSYIAFTAYPVTAMTWIMAGAMLVYLAERGYRSFIPKGQRLSLEEWRKQHGLGEAAGIDMADVKPIEDILSAPDVQSSRPAQSQMQGYKKAIPLVGIFAVIVFGVGIYQGIKIARLEAAGLRVQGQVVRLKGENSSGNRGGYSYYAIVRFRTQTNATVEFKDNVGSNPPSHRPGDDVTVLYLADDPQQDAIIDRGIWWNWAIPGILFLTAAFLAWLLLAMRRSQRAEKPGGLLAVR